MNHTVGSYKKVQVETIDSLKLVVMLYEGAINFLEQAKKRLAENQVAEKGVLINKVVAILSELQGSLNLKKGGEVAVSLDRLYTYMIGRLGEANLNNDSAILTEISQHLRQLKSAWSQIAVQGSAKSTEQPAVTSPESSAKPAQERPRQQPAAIELVG